MVGVEDAVAILDPHWNEIEDFFEAENVKFKALLKTDHTNFGRILNVTLFRKYM